MRYSMPIGSYSKVSQHILDVGSAMFVWRKRKLVPDQVAAVRIDKITKKAKWSDKEEKENDEDYDLQKYLNGTQDFKTVEKNIQSLI